MRACLAESTPGLPGLIHFFALLTESTPVGPSDASHPSGGRKSFFDRVRAFSPAARIPMIRCPWVLRSTQTSIFCHGVHLNGHLKSSWGKAEASNWRFPFRSIPKGSVTPPNITAKEDSQLILAKRGCVKPPFEGEKSGEPKRRLGNPAKPKRRLTFDLPPGKNPNSSSSDRFPLQNQQGRIKSVLQQMEEPPTWFCVLQVQSMWVAQNPANGDSRKGKSLRLAPQLPSSSARSPRGSASFFHLARRRDRCAGGGGREGRRPEKAP